MSEKNHTDNNFKGGGWDFHPVVTGVSALLVLAFIVYGIIYPDASAAFFKGIKGAISQNLGWFFILGANIILFFVLAVALGPFGKIRIGGMDCKPEFSNFSWYAMFLSAGMGIGLMFWGVAEPIYHFASPMPIFGNALFADILGEGEQAKAVQAMGVAFYHWGIHPWAIYTLLGLALAFVAYNRNLPMTLRTTFYPLFGKKVYGPLGNIVDILAVLATLFGLATSLGFGAQQINAGLHWVFGVPANNLIVQIVIIAVITLLATASVVSGLEKGIKILSEINIKIAVVFMVAVAGLGATVYVMQTFSSGVGFYLQNFFQMSFWSQTGESAWQDGWTVFYWGWWISWSPFVGVFLARISRGRTVREFIFAVILIPVILSFIWMAVFGGNAIYQEMNGREMVKAVSDDMATALFQMVKGLNVNQVITFILYLLGIVMVITFFVTSSDSGSLVVEYLTSGGKLITPKRQQVIWAFMEGIIAAVLLSIGGSQALSAIQTASVLTGLPFLIILLILCYSIHKGLKRDLKKYKEYEEKRLTKLINGEIESE